MKKFATLIEKYGAWALERLPWVLAYVAAILIVMCVGAQFGIRKGRVLEREAIAVETAELGAAIASLEAEVGRTRERMFFEWAAQVKKMEVTGYSNDPISINVPEWLDGLTANMTPVRRGTCAADWRVHPVGTVFYVPGYGLCIVEDRGSAIKGNKLDLFFDTYDEAREWGRRKNMSTLVFEKG